MASINKFNNGFNASLTNGFGGFIGGSTALGAWGLVSMIGGASTGTALSSLSGVAATNATFAWFGGGTLASGGVGIFGGYIVLGSIVAAPMVYFLTKDSYNKASLIKQEKFRLISEIKEKKKTKIIYQDQLNKSIKKYEEIAKIVNQVAPAIEEAIKLFKSNSSLKYRLFGGKMNNNQEAIAKNIEALCYQSLTELGLL